eukprot:TRINITY_DN8962_c0_g1_i10.p1 TRINITY_DN8962_c0_g1~~TRINITY_DN8962_c0_g1_i10.p1  ORF type:complete len:597 (-),score=95.50 TRINITY_DN8962_c0_g1_i10:178-1968(-)
MLKSLRTLHMDDNEISVVPSSISALSHLEVLTLSHNNITIVNPSIGSLKELYTLVLNDNSLEEWPTFRLVRLRKLHLHDNPKIKAIPLCFSEFSHLKEFTHDWCDYLPNRNRQTSSHIAQIKNMCKVMRLNNPSATHCTFSAFLNHFVLSMKKYQKEVFPLHIAARKCHNDIMRELIKSVDINLQDRKCQTALAVAMKAKNREGVDILLKHEQVDVNCTVLPEGTVLHAALKSAWLDIAESIIDHPLFKPNLLDSQGNTPLHLLFESYMASSERAKVLCRKLLAVPGNDLNLRNSENMTALHCAAKNGQREYVEMCLQYKESIDLNAAGGSEGYSVLHYVAVYCAPKLICSLLLCGINVMAKDRNGRMARDVVKNSLGEKMLRRYGKRVRCKELDTNESTLIKKKSTLKVTLYSEEQKAYSSRFRKTAYRHVISRRPISLVRDAEENCVTQRAAGNSLMRPNKLVKAFNPNNLPFIAQQGYLVNSNPELQYNKYKGIYTKILENDLSKYRNYRLLYYLLSEGDDDAEICLGIICKTMPDRNPLLKDVKHLHKVLVERKNKKDPKRTLVKEPSKSRLEINNTIGVDTLLPNDIRVSM